MREQRGFTYVVVMFLVAALSIAAVRALESTKVAEQRDKEAQLLWIGNAYRNAIAAYYRGAQGSSTAYPASLSDLLYDSRPAIPARYLRKLYRDPITGSEDWGLVKDDAGGIIGVYSLSQARPAKQDGFPAELANFINAKHYSDWKFLFKQN